MKNIKKVLVMGSSGMLGHAVVNFLLNSPKFIIYDVSFRFKIRPKTIILNVMHKAPCEDLIVELKPDYIINCIGDLVSDKPNYERAIYLNSYFPHFLKNICKKINCQLIHISTDCVFSGSKGAYLELDYRDGEGLYAETKKMGEIIDRKNLTLRSSIIGPELKKSGVGLFQWFINQDKELQGYKHSIWSGVTTLELARAIKWAIDFDVTGIYHITNGSSISKHDLLELFKKHLNRDINIIPIDGKKQDKSFVDSRKLINYKIPSYEEMVIEMIKEIKLNNDKYNYKYI